MAAHVGIPPWDIGPRTVVVARVSALVPSLLAGRTSRRDSKLSGDALALRDSTTVLVPRLLTRARRVDRSQPTQDRSAVADRPVEAADRTGRSSGSTGPAGRAVRPDRPVRPSAGSESDRPVKEPNPTGRRRERSVASSPSDSELERESRRERRRHGRSRRRGDRVPTPPQTSSLATDQILKAIAELNSATDAVASRVRGWSGGRVLRTLLIPHSPHGWRRRIFLSVSAAGRSHVIGGGGYP